MKTASPIVCPHCRNSSIPTIFWRDDGWAGCVQAGTHWAICKQDSQAAVLAWLERRAEVEFAEWNILGEQMELRL